MKKLLWGFLLLLLLLAVAGGGWWVYQSKDALIADAIRSYGPQITGVSVKLGGVKLEPTEGTFVISQLELGNPKGFKTPHALVVQQLQIKLDVGSLTQDAIHIQRITIAQPQVAYEHASGGSNLDVIQRNVEAYIAAHSAGGQGAGNDADKAAGSSQTKIIIDQFSMLGAKADVSAEALHGQGVTVTLPDVQIKDIGKKSGGVSPAVATSQAVAGVRQSVMHAVSPLHLDGVVDSLKKGASSVVDKVKGFFK
jgi:uncharacterized protein involved in outer membrane biogenesis